MPDRTPVRLWRWLAALAIFGNVATGIYAELRPFSGRTMEMVSAHFPTLLTPADYTFSIWGLIFGGMLLYAIWQLLPAQVLSVVPSHVAKLLLLVNALTAAWMVVFAHEWILLSLSIMLLILLGLILVYDQVREAVLTKVLPWWVSIPFSLYLSWVAVAFVLNVAISLHKIQFGAAITLDVTYGVLALLVAVTVLVAGRFQDFAFLPAPIWAMVGIWVARVHDVPNLGWAALGAAVGTALLGFALVRQRTKRQWWEISAEAAEAENQRLRAEA